jgi:translation initiation factor 2 beta subunit (eIF-2beta)/eIF-5
VGAHVNEDTGKRTRTKEQREYDKALDRAYQSAIKKIPEAEKKSDPWRDIRPTAPSAAKNKQQ